MRSEHRVNNYSVRIYSALSAAVLLISVYVAHAQETALQPSTQPGLAMQRMLSAKKVYLMASAPNSALKKTPGLFGQKLADGPLALAALAKAVKQWGRFEVVDDAASADLILWILEWNEVTKWGKNLQCHNRLFVFDGGAVPKDDSIPIWNTEEGGQWGGCSAAKVSVKALRKELEKNEKAGNQGK